MASQREVLCRRCGRQMWIQPEVRAVQCSNCRTVTQLYSPVDNIANGANRLINGLQQFRRKQQPQVMAQPQPPPRQYHKQQPPQMMSQSQPPQYHEQQQPQTVAQPSWQRKYQEPQMMPQSPPPRQYHEQQQPQMMALSPPQYHEQQPQTVAQPSWQHKYHEEQEPQMMHQSPPLQYHEQQPQTVAQPSYLEEEEEEEPQMMPQSPLQYHEQQPQMLAQPFGQRTYHEEQEPQMMAQQPPRRQYQQPQMMNQPPPRRQYREQQQPQMMNQPPPRRQYREQQQPQMMNQPTPQYQYPKQQTMAKPPPQSPHQYPKQQPQMMVQQPPQHQYRKQQQQMMARQSPPRQLEPLPSAFGKKRAVLCGVDYRGKSYSLKGCISDAKSMRSLLVQQMGFPIDSVLMLTEDEANPKRIPTKKNIRNAMRWLVEGNRARDSLVFHFSGHGSQQKDYDGDDVDGQDETIAPLDHETEGKIIDDEINRTLVRPLVHGAKLHAIIDACNSGTVLDLPFICRMERNGSYEWEDHRSVGVYKGTDGGSALCFSACDDDESSGYTPVFTGKDAGAMTYSFIKAVKTAGPAPTYGHLLNLMCSAVREGQSRLNYTNSDASAEPMLTSSEEFDVYKKKFVL